MGNRGWAALLVLAVELAACGGSTPPTANDAETADAGIDAGDPGIGAQSGSRLKLRWHEYEDGTRVWLPVWPGTTYQPYFDAQLNENCAAATWADGNVYCTPEVLTAYDYSDPQCTIPIVSGSGSGCTPPPGYGATREPASCYDLFQGPISRVYRLSKLAVPYRRYQRSSNGTCTDMGLANTEAYGGVTEVRSTDLVRITETDSIGSGDFGVRYLQSMDGFRVPWMLHDNTRDFDCDLQSGHGEVSATCLPRMERPSPIRVLYGDQQCSQPLVQSSADCAVPDFGYLSTTTNCWNNSATYYKVGSTVAPDSVYGYDPSACELQAQSPTQVSYSTSPLSPGTVARAPQMIADHRIHVVQVTTAQVSYPDDSAVSASLYDSMLGTECQTMLASDGSLRCVPKTIAQPSVNSLFADASCLTSIDLHSVRVWDPTCDTTPPVDRFAVKWVVASFCAPGVPVYGMEVYEVGGRYTGPVYQRQGTTCAALDTTRVEFFRVGPVIPSSSFAPATLQTD